MRMDVHRADGGGDDGGFTLMELAITLALVVIIAAIAFPNVSHFIARYRLNRAAERLASHVTLCRTTAISSNRECAIQFTAADPNPSSGDWHDNVGAYRVLLGDASSGSTSWTAASLGPGSDGIVDLSQGSGEIEGVSIETWGTLAGAANGSLPDAMIFGCRGHMNNAASDFVDTYLRVVFRNKADNIREGRAVLVDRSGIPQVVIP